MREMISAFVYAFMESDKVVDHEKKIDRKEREMDELLTSLINRLSKEYNI